MSAKKRSSRWKRKREDFEDGTGAGSEDYKIVGRHVNANDDDDNDDDDEQDLTLANQRLPVAELPDNFNGTPQDGLEYLAVVRREANLTSDVMKISGDTLYVPLRSVGAAASASALASASGQDHASTSYATLIPSDIQSEWSKNFIKLKEKSSWYCKQDKGRTAVDWSVAPTCRNADEWFTYLHGCSADVPQKGNESNMQDVLFRSVKLAVKPTPQLTLLQLANDQIVALLESFTVWLSESWLPKQDGTSASALSGLTAIPDAYSQFIFAILAKLEKDLSSNDMSTLRSLARACIDRICCFRTITATPNGSSTGKHEQQVKQEGEAGAWLVFTIIVTYWHQSDLWDEANAKLSKTTLST